MAIFLSTFCNKLDKKGRVSMPASYRHAINFSDVILFKSYKEMSIEACDMSLMERLVQNIDTLDIFSTARNDFAAVVFSDCQQVSLDSEGRLNLTKELIEYAQLTDQVLFAGYGSTFKLWNPDNFKINQQESRKRMQEQNFKLKLVDIK